MQQEPTMNFVMQSQTVQLVALLAPVATVLITSVLAFLMLRMKGQQEAAARVGRQTLEHVNGGFARVLRRAMHSAQRAADAAGATQRDRDLAEEAVREYEEHMATQVRVHTEGKR